jgi:hypothetical protein
MTKRDLVERLEAIVSNACALSLCEPASGAIDERAMLQEFENRWLEVGLLAGDIVPDLERMEDRLKATISQLPESVGRAARDYRISNLKWRPDPVPMPREIAAFVVLERVEAAQWNCRYLLAKARYDELREGEACDCSARMEAGFFSGRPQGPLRLLDSIGVPYAAMFYLWICQICGQKWNEEEAPDDMSANISWRPAAKDATRA